VYEKYEELARSAVGSRMSGLKASGGDQAGIEEPVWAGVVQILEAAEVVPAVKHL
jgi:hypothetical protein